MLNISKTSIIYVLCPSYNKTGGTELAHQLVYAINQIGQNAQITYFENGNNPMDVNPAFKRYVDAYTNICDVVDSSENVIIIPEINTKYEKNFKKMQKCIWWMSVDNYTKWNHIATAYQNFGLWSTIKGVLKGRLKVSPYPHFDENIIHFYQSEYARDFLEKSGITRIHRLSDYLNDEYLNVDFNTDRKDFVLYNPRKGFKFTKRLIASAPDITWIPLQNMTTEQVKDTLLHSKVYIDFGNHPGKDRFPREAAMCGCCVITGKRGSASFFEDIPIDEEFKFDESKNSICAIINKIRTCLKEYENQSNKFERYRDFIRNEYALFQKDVDSIFAYRT